MGKRDMDSILKEALSVFTDEAAELLRSLDLTLNELFGADEADRTRLFRDMLRALHTLKGAAAVVGKEDIRRHVHELEETVRKLSDGEVPLDALATQELSSGVEEVHLAVMRMLGARDEEPVQPATPALVVASPPPAAPAVPAVPAPSPARSSARGDFLRLKPEKVDSIHALVGDLVVARLQYQALSRRMATLRDRTTEATGSFRSLAAHIAGLRGALPARAHAELTARVTAMGSLLSDVTRETSAVAGDFPMLQAHATAVSTSLEEGIRDLRLMPLSSFFEDHAKVVRETARETGKEARLLVQAGGAEVDRHVLVRLRDALSHLVRNAVVHGIEAQELRESQGKSACGIVRLEGHIDGSRAVLRIADDGAGIDREAVRRKAVRLGLLRPDEALREEALLDILTQPGFSTRDAADALSGRGIGLDVVAAAVRDLDGHMEVSSAPGVGTVFTIEVPVTAVAGMGLLVKVGEHAFGILLSHVERAIRVGPDDIRVLESHETVKVGDDLLSIVPLGALVGLPGSQLPAEKAPAVVLRMGKQRLVVTVDDVPGDQALVVKPLGRAFAGATHLSGGAVQPDGSVLPVLHVPALFLRAAGAARARPSSATPSLPPPLRRHEETAILVVDDSMTMRTLLRNILRADHYEVQVAHDGKAALDVLDSMPRCDLVVTDLQMPRMDGVELCAAIRRSSRAHLPVMVVTSVGDANEKRLALESGADAYVVKADFEQSRFLELVARLSGGPGRMA